MTIPDARPSSTRRTVLKAAAATAALQLEPPFISSVRAETPLRIGMVDPMTGVYAAVAQNEVTGAKLAVEQINAKGGILGRPIELLVEDSANDVGTGVQKTRKLIERDEVPFIIGDVNSGIAQAMAQVTAEKTAWLEVIAHAQSHLGSPRSRSRSRSWRSTRNATSWAMCGRCRGRSSTRARKACWRRRSG